MEDQWTLGAWPYSRQPQSQWRGPHAVAGIRHKNATRTLRIGLKAVGFKPRVRSATSPEYISWARWRELSIGTAEKDDLGVNQLVCLNAWWPSELGTPSVLGVVSGLRYAFFPLRSRLVTDDGEAVSLYDTGNASPSGFHSPDGRQLRCEPVAGRVRPVESVFRLIRRSASQGRSDSRDWLEAVHVLSHA